MTEERQPPDYDDIRVDETAYERACSEAIEECKDLDPPYHPTAWIGMIRQRGAGRGLAGRRPALRRLPRHRVPGGRRNQPGRRGDRPPAGLSCRNGELGRLRED